MVQLSKLMLCKSKLNQQLNPCFSIIVKFRPLHQRNQIIDTSIFSRKLVVMIHKNGYSIDYLNSQNVIIGNQFTKMLRIQVKSWAFFSTKSIKTPFPTVNHQPRPYNGPSYDQVIKDRGTYMPNFYYHYYKKPLLIVQGHLQYLYDHEGKRYIDLCSGISTVSCGHSHPAITKIISQQAGTLIHTSPIYANPYQGEYSKKLCQELGEGFDSVYLCNSGGQANDFAVYLSRLYTQEYKFFSLKNAYHGMAGNAGNLTNIGTWNTSMRGGFQFQRFAWPAPYRSNHSTVDQLIKDAQETLNCASNGKVAGFIFEPIMGASGIYLHPQGYLPRMINLVRKHGGLIVCDQVQTGFGRMGSKSWGFKWQGIKPDIITMAKSIGNGLPMAAVVTRKEITDRLKQIYFNTFGGGFMQCRVGMEVLDIIKREKLNQNAEKVGSYLLTQLKKLVPKYRIIGDVRGQGLMIGIEIVKDKESKQPGKDEIAQLFELTRQRGILFSKGGSFGNCIRIQPPLCLTMEDAKYILQAIEDSLIQMKC